MALPLYIWHRAIIRRMMEGATGVVYFGADAFLILFNPYAIGPEIRFQIRVNDKIGVEQGASILGGSLLP